MGCCNKMPGYSKLIQNLALTAKNAISHAIKTGEIMAEKEVIQRRINRCYKCQFLVGTRCSQCGCFVVAKTGLKVSECPMKYW